jgi:hypothetical protein
MQRMNKSITDKTYVLVYDDIALSIMPMKLKEENTSGSKAADKCRKTIEDHRRRSCG